MKNKYRYVKFLQTGMYGVIAALILLQCIFTNNLVYDGHEVSQIELKIRQYRMENVALSQQVAAGQSIATLTQKALEAGFVHPQNILTISRENQVALKK